MTAPGNGTRQYEVHCSSVIAETCRQLQRSAVQRGQGEAVNRAFRDIVQRLRVDAPNVGEPAYRLPGLRLQVRKVIVRPLFVDFAVSEDRPLVFIKGVRLLSGPSS